jgi:hypothetical protein
MHNVEFDDDSLLVEQALREERERLAAEAVVAS